MPPSAHERGDMLNFKRNTGGSRSVILVLIAGMALAACGASTGSVAGSSSASPRSGVGSAQTNSTPEQRFVASVRSIPLSTGGTIGDEIAEGTVSTTAVGQVGDDTCNYIEGKAAQGYTDSAYTLATTSLGGGKNFEPGDPTFGMSLSNAELLVSGAISDICPSEQSIIPYGDPGAS
jgi:hypothetical protein